MTQEINSAQNARFRAVLKLQQSSRERRKAGLSLLDGTHLVAAYLEHVGRPEQIVVSRSRRDEPEVARVLAGAGVEPVVLSDALFHELSSVATPTGIVAVVKTPRPQSVPKEPGACVMLEDIQDPGNVGSILRSAAAAGVTEIYCSKQVAHAWSPRVLRAGMGAHFVLGIYENVDLLALAERYAGRVVAASLGADRSLYEVDLTGPVALLFGSEGAGLSPELCERAHERIAIPMSGQVESLNVAAAAAICLFERVRQQRVPSPPTISAGLARIGREF